MICVNSVRVTPRSITIKKGSWYYGVNAEVCPANADCRDVSWSSSNSAIASVNASSGYIYARSAGTAKIYASATDGSGKSDYMIVQVTSSPILVRSVELNRSSLSLEAGGSYTLSAVVCPENANKKSLSWSSSNPNVAVVSGGRITAIAKGHAMIKATAQDGSGISDCCNVYVTGDTLVTSVTVSPSVKTMTVGESVYLHETVCPVNAANRCVRWSSSNTNAVTVNPESGFIYAKAAGKAAIYATATDGSGKKGSCVITVNGIVYADSVTLSRSSLVLYKGDTHCLTATVCPADTTKKTIKWSSSKPGVATVSSKGLVTAISAGTTAICATAQDGSCVCDCCTVTVKQISSCPEPETPKSEVTGSTVADPIDVYSGAHVITNTVMTLFGGQNLKLTANYDSSKLATGILGSGWYHNYEKHLEISKCGARVYSSPSAYSIYEPNGDCTAYTCTTARKNGYILTVDCSQQYPYAVQCNIERTEYYNAAGNLAKIVDHRGFETLIDYTDHIITITDTASGKKLYLEKDAAGKLSKVYDDGARETTFTYNGDLLISICGVNGNRLTYAYNEDGQIKSGTDSKNIRYFENTYDDCGRVITQKDAISGSRTSAFAYEDNGRRIATDRNGNQSIRVFNDNGLLVSHTDENGNTKNYQYDDRYNVTEETDANCNSVLKSYNCFNKPTMVTDKNGNITDLFYDEAGNIVKIRYPEMNGIHPEEIFAYNTRNQLIRHTDLRGTVTLYTYDAAGMPASKKAGSRNAIQYSYQNGLLLAETDAAGNTTRYGYNAIGQRTSRTDADNNTTFYEYDACGNLLKTTDAAGKTIVNTYDGNYQKTSVTDANGNRIEYSYNGNMKNDAVLLPDGNRIRYEYDGEDRQIKVTDQAGHVTATQYDKAGRILSKRLPDGGTIQYEYDKAGRVVKEINPKGAAVVKTYDANGNVLSVTDAHGNASNYYYNALSKVIRTVNAVSGTTVYEYSPAGDLLSETDALGNQKTYTYDAFGNKLTFTDALGNLTAYTYDPNGNLLTVRDALGNLTTYTYNALHQIVSVKDAKNHVVRYGYDALGRRTTVTDAENNVFTTVYDANGNVLKTIDAKGDTVSETVYNSLNLPAAVTDPAGKTTTYLYNALGKVQTAADSMQHISEYSYDTRGRNTGVRDAANGFSSEAFDTLGMVTRRSGPLGGNTDYTYDDTGRLIVETTASGGTVSYTYNELNVKKQLTNARGQIRKYFYDAAGRITGCVTPEGSINYTYDANGNVLTVTSGNGSIKRAYDALNRVIQYTDTFGKVIRYEYDAAGNLVRMVYPDNTAVRYAYDANDRMVSVTDWAGRVTSYTYDANGRVTGTTKPDGSVTAAVYDNKQRIASTVTKTAAGDIITGFAYVYDTLGRISAETHLASDTKIFYTYDALNRVIKRTNLSEEVLSEENYSYDAAGNITGAPDGCFSYDTNNRLTVLNGLPAAYDMDGNMLSAYLGGAAAAFEYDSANRLTNAGGNEYTYDAEDMRIRTLCGGNATTYVYNIHCKLSQLLQKTADGITTKYVYGLGLIGEEDRGEFKTYHFDCRGSTIAVTDTSGRITDTFTYDTYGRQTGRTGSSVVLFGYNGRDGAATDQNGLVYMRARYYSPELRRFINADVIPGVISDAVTLNRYAYANGNPVSNTDPFGLEASRGNWIPDAWQYTQYAPDLQEISYRGYNYFKYGFNVNKNGNYAIIKGARSTAALRQDIYGTRYALRNADDYTNVFKYVSPKVAVKDAFSITNAGKMNWGGTISYATIGIDVGIGIYENIQEDTRTQKIVSDAIVDAGIGAGCIAISTGAGAAIGSVVPVAGNVIGAAGGFVVGVITDFIVNTDFIDGKSLADLAKDAGGWVADKAVDTGEWVADKAVDAGHWIADKAEDCWDWVTGLFD